MPKILFFLLLMLAINSNADINKCVINGKITYTEAACPDNTQQALDLKETTIIESVLPDFYGTYQGMSANCYGTILVFKEDFVSLTNYCKKGKYEILEHDRLHISVKPQESDECKSYTIQISQSPPQNGLPSFGGFKLGIEGSICSIGRVDDSMGEDQTDTFLHSKDAEARKKALRIINNQELPDRQEYNKIALKDESPEIRAMAADYLPGHAADAIPLLITTMAHDPDSTVRAAAGSSLADYYDWEGCTEIEAIASNLDDFAIALKNEETESAVISLLGSPTRGNSLISCCMSEDKRNQSLSILKNRGKNLSTFSSKIQEAIKNVSRCPNPNKSTQPNPGDTHELPGIH